LEDPTIAIARNIYLSNANFRVLVDWSFAHFVEANLHHPQAYEEILNSSAEFPQTDRNKEVVSLLTVVRQEDHLSLRPARQWDGFEP
jgi:hypothetical protein